MSTPATAGLRLSVAAINLRTSLRSVGVDASGVISPPAGQARWVRGFGRVQPGKVGTAVIAGHVVSSGDPDVFSRLSSVRVGNEVVVTSGSMSRTYVVTRAAVVKKSALTHDADVWGQNTSKRRIVLITCDDELGYRSDGHRVANYVVVADAL
ncbi:putative membrane protein [Janibacter sp. HTCC2649]|nr:putative membrane protein [Janibacter sp. HTCC2649]